MPDEFHDPADSIHASYEHHPMDEIEPKGADQELIKQKEGYRQGYRDAAVKWMFIFNRAFDLLEQAESPALAVWQIAFALGLGMCEGRSMTKIAEKHGVTRACISKGARRFCKLNDLPPSFYMKSEEAADKARDIRLDQL